MVISKIQVSDPRPSWPSCNYYISLNSDHDHLAAYSDFCVNPSIE